MPSYKWSGASDWLDSKLNALTKPEELRSIARALASALDNDGIQDLFQAEMASDGFFVDLDKINSLPRDACVELLEAVSIECRDEGVDVLREAVRVNVVDGTIDASELENYS